MTEFSYKSKPITQRPPLVWPNGARLAFAVNVCVEHYELAPPKGSFQPPTLPGGFGKAPYPDFRSYSLREYGNRIGVFRVMDVLERHGLQASAAVDAFIARNRPYLVSALKSRACEIVGHGMAVTQVISENMSQTDERAYILSSLDALEQAFGVRPAGWHGPEYGESSRTPGLLAEHGLTYLLDWPNDEQPYQMSTAAGNLVAI